MTTYAAEPAASVPAYELKNRSSFGINPGARTPLWPIGWKKGNAAFVPALNKPQVVTKAFQIQPSHFTVTSVLLATPPVAIINGRGFAVGESLPVVVGDKPVNVIVTAIRDGGVWLAQGSHQIFVPLRRQELVPRQATDPVQSKEQFKIQIQDPK
jgi:hypothetical protein